MPKIGDKRIGICKHTNKKLEQVYDGVSDDASDEKGWLCLHDEKENHDKGGIMSIQITVEVDKKEAEIIRDEVMTRRPNCKLPTELAAKLFIEDLIFRYFNPEYLIAERLLDDLDDSLGCCPKCSDTENPIPLEYAFDTDYAMLGDGHDNTNMYPWRYCRECNFAEKIGWR